MFGTDFDKTALLWPTTALTWGDPIRTTLNRHRNYIKLYS